jgi:DNA-nicking Smr family endonuclease
MAKASHRSGGPGPGRAKPGADVHDPSAGGEDAGLFRAAVRDVKPLPPTERREPSPSHAGRRKKGGSARSVAGSSVRGAGPRAADGGARSAIEDSDPCEHASRADDFPDVALEDDSPTGADTLTFRRPGVRDRTLRQLRRGLYPIEDHLDLHGLSQAEARESLGDFLAYSRGAGYRCVRIVHGKGYRSGARGPILKISVNAWLRRHADVMAFTSARPIDGGAGAVYVLLRA